MVADGRQILSKIDGAALPGRMLAIMGPSGAGKTSLLQVVRSVFAFSALFCVPDHVLNIKFLQVLAGVLPQARNQVLHGEIGGECCSNGDRDAAAFVGQDDRFYSHLSVRETLLVAAKLRLPRLGRAKSQDVVDELLRQLHLSHVRSEISSLLLRGKFLDPLSRHLRCHAGIHSGNDSASGRDTRVGDERSRGISGGERRRLALGSAPAPPPRGLTRPL